MKKRNIYLYILISAVAIILFGFLLEISLIKDTSRSTFNSAINPWIAASAAICAFLFINKKHYWFIMLGCAIIISIALQFLVFKASGISINLILIRSLAFLSIVYILNYLKLLIGK